MDTLISNLISLDEDDYDNEMDDWEQQKIIIEKTYNPDIYNIKIEPTKLLISTLSFNCTSTPTRNENDNENIVIDIALLIKHLEINLPKQFINFQKSQNISRKNQINGCGNHIFYNQITLTINPYYDPDNNINRITSIKVRLFQNGSIGVCGMKNCDASDGKLAVNILFDFIKTIPENIYNIDKSILNIYNFKTSFTNSNFNFNTPFYIDRNKLYNLLISHNYLVSLTIKYPAVKLCFYYNDSYENNDGICKCNIKCIGKGDGSSNGGCKCINIPMFQSGAVLINGIFEHHHLVYVYNFITNYLISHISIIRQLSSKPHIVKSEKIKIEIKPAELIHILNFKKKILNNI